MIDLHEPPPELAPAAHFRRLTAFLMDVALCGFISFGVVAAAHTVLATLSTSGDGETAPPVGDGLRDALVFAPLTSFALYSLLSWGLSGTSPGKWLVGLRLVGPAGTRIGFLRATIRLGVIIGLALSGAMLGAVVQDRGLFAFRGLRFESLGLALVLISCLPALVRRDRAPLHDLIARTRAVQSPQSGLRRLTRGAIRQSLRDARWAIAIVLTVIVGGTGLVLGVRTLAAVQPPQPAASSAPVDAVTQEIIKGAILEYDRMEEHATFRLDASILEPRATQTWLGKKAAEFAELRRRGLRQESRLIEVDWKGFRWVDTDVVEADIVETWVSVIGDTTGRVLQEMAAHQVPQTAVLARDRGRWRVSDVRQYDAGDAPF